MDKDTALAIAASDSGIPTELLKEAISRYANLVSICPNCEGEGAITVTHPTDLKWSFDKDVMVGDSVPCFACAKTGKDSRYATWICKQRVGDCKPDDAHTGPDTFCGWAVAT